MYSLAEQDSILWNPEKVRQYTKAEIRTHRGSKGDVKGQKRRHYMKYGNRWHMRHRSAAAIWRVEVKNKINWAHFRQYLNDYLSEYDGNKNDFAEEMNLLPQTLSKYISGSRTPSCKFFVKFAEKMEIPYQQFEANFRTDI